MKIIKTYCKRDVKKIIESKGMNPYLYIQALTKHYVILKPRDDGSYAPLCYPTTSDPIYFKSIEETKGEFISKTDVIMSAYAYLNQTCGISINH